MPPAKPTSQRTVKQRNLTDAPPDQMDDQLQRLIGADPLVRAASRAKLFNAPLFASPVKTYAVLCLMFAAYYFPLGVGLSLYYGEKVIPLWSPAELLNGLPVFFLTIPVILTYCFDQPRALHRMIGNLETKGIIPAPKASAGAHDQPARAILREKIESYFQGWAISGGAFFIAVVATFFFNAVIIANENLSLNASHSSGSAKIAFLYITSPGRVSFLLIWGLALYAISVYALRHFMVIYSFFKYFGQDGAIQCVYPFDPDNGGGLGEIAQYSVNIGRLSIVIAVQFFVFVIHPAVVPNGSFNLENALILGFVYALFVPFSVFLPIYPVHIGMSSYRANQIRKISRNSQLVIAQTLIAPDNENLARLKTSKEICDFITENIPTWPNRLVALRFSIVATAIPAILTLVTSSIEIIDRVKAFIK